MQVRDAAAADIPHLVAFNQAMALETEDKALPDATVGAGVERLFDEPARGFYLVVEREGNVAGSLMITYEWSDWRNADFWWIQSVYIAPEHRRHGCFAALYAEVTARAKAAGACGVRLYVEKENTRAQATYQRLGMAETHYHMYEIEFG